MKKLLFNLLALILLCGKATAQTVTVADVYALPGNTVSFALNLINGKADTYTSLQFDAEFPAGFTTTDNYFISPAWKNASAVVGDVIDGVATIPVSSAEVITGSDVEGLFTVYFKVGESVVVGDYDVTLRNITFGYGFTDKDIAPDVTFTVHVVNTVVLDENATSVPVEAENVNVLVKRTIKGGEWSTICLPFAMTEEQVKSAFGEDVQLGDFKGYKATEDVDEKIVGIKVNIAEVKPAAIEANHPYIIKVGHDISSFTVDNVNIVPEEKPTVAAVKRTKKQWSELIGTYVPVTLDEEMLYLSGNKFWYSDGQTQMKAYRAYFDFYDVLDIIEDANAHISIVLENNGLPTGIQNVQQQNATGIYDLQGRRILKVHKEGLYIRDGKKIVKRASSKE